MELERWALRCSQRIIAHPYHRCDGVKILQNSEAFCRVRPKIAEIVGSCEKLTLSFVNKQMTGKLALTMRYFLAKWKLTDGDKSDRGIIQRALMKGEKWESVSGKRRWAGENEGEKKEIQVEWDRNSVKKRAESISQVFEGENEIER